MTLQYFCLESPMDWGAWWAAVHGVAKNRTQLSNFPFTFHFHAVEEEMATHSSVLAWRSPGTGETGGLPSMGSHRVGHDWSDLAAYDSNLTFAFQYTMLCIKKQRHHFANKGLYSQNYDFSSSHVWMWELNHKEAWASKNRCLQIVVLEKTLESPLDCRKIKPVNPKEKHPWIFVWRTDAEAEAPILWTSVAKSQLIGKDSGAGKDWSQKEKGSADDVIVR